MPEKINILITGAGGTTGQSIIKALRISSLTCRLIAADTHPLAAGIYRADAGYLLPAADQPQYIPRLIDVCRQENIQVILIGSTPEVPVLARHRDEIQKNCHALAVVSEKETVDICHNKYNTCQFLKQNNLPGPETVDISDRSQTEMLIQKRGFPLLLKPQQGCAARHVHVINSREEFDFFARRINEPALLQEYLPGDDEEYTCGLFYSRDHRRLGEIIMKRQLSYGGTYRGMTDDFNDIRDYIRRVGDALAPTGPINIQLRNTPAGPVLFEINPRFSCSDAMRAQMGYNAPEAAVRHFLFGQEVRHLLRWRKAISLRYINEVLITHEDYEKLVTQGHLDTCSGVPFTGF